MADEPREKLAALMADILGAPISTLRDVRREDVAGWDSLNHMRIVMAVEEAFSIRVPAEAFGGLDSFSAILRLVEGAR